MNTAMKRREKKLYNTPIKIRIDHALGILDISVSYLIYSHRRLVMAMYITLYEDIKLHNAVHCLLHQYGNMAIWQYDKLVYKVKLVFCTYTEQHERMNY